MIWISSSLCLLVVSGWTPVRGDIEVSCAPMGSCILPCSFNNNASVLIHWTTKDIYVHSYYKDQDQLKHQGQRFRGRTSLFKEQISRGNASLQLTEVEVQDQGRYLCYIATDKADTATSSYINLKVDAPVGEVDIQQVGNRITCSSKGIYPEPELTWSTSPPSNVTFDNTATVQQTEQQLYNISSSLIVSDSVTDLVYSCTVSTRINSRRASLFKAPSIFSVCGAETTIPCTSSNTTLTKLIWRFNLSQIILIQTRTDRTVSEEWRQQVKDVSESGKLTLQELSSNQEGIYTCELRNEEETKITNTFLRTDNCQGISTSDVGIIIGVVAASVIVGAVLVGLVIYCKKTRGCQRDTEPNNDGPTETELRNINRAQRHEHCGDPANILLQQKAEEEDSKVNEEEDEPNEPLVD